MVWYGMVWYGNAIAQSAPPDSLVVTVKFKITDTNYVSPNNLSLIQNVLDTHDVFLFERIFPFVDHPELNPWFRMKCVSCNPDSLSSDLMSITYIVDASETSKIRSLSCPILPNSPNDYEAMQPIASWYLDKINAQGAWELTHGNENIIVGVIDGGFHVGHPELSGKYIPAISGQNLEAVYDMDIDPNIHGLGVACLIAGETNNDLGLASIGYNTRLALGRATDITEALLLIQLLFDSGVRIFNLSFVIVRPDGNCNFDESEALLFEGYRNNGAFFIASAGNGSEMDYFGNSFPECEDPSTKMYPASYDAVFSVTGLDSVDINSNQFNYNSSVDLAAPGVEMYTISDTTITSSGLLNGVRVKLTNGSSNSAPLVAGTVALMKAVNPCLLPDDIEAILKESSDTIPWQGIEYESVNLYDENGNYDTTIYYDYPILLGAGRLNAGNAVKLAMDWPFDYPEGLVITSNSDLIEDLNGDGIIRIRGNLVFTEDVDDFSISNKIFEFQRDCSIEPSEAPYYDQSGVIVQVGAKAQFNNCVFRPVSYCPEMFPEDADQMWDGMQVWGDEEIIFTQGFPILWGISIAPVQHGELILSNCAVEDAAIGVTCYRRNYSLRFDDQHVVEYGSGILKASNTTFRNNWIGVDMRSNRPPNVRNESEITKCSFIANQALASNVLYEDNPTNTFIRMNNVRNPLILGCTFEGTAEYADEGLITGIRSINARYQLKAVAEYIDNSGNQYGQIDNEFTDLFKGVDINNLTAISNGIVLRDATYTGVLQGITASNAHFMEIAFNTFNCFEDHDTYDTWGAFLRGCQSGLVTENEFVGPFEDPEEEGNGLVIRNNNVSPVHVYKNNFTQTFYVASQMEQANATTFLQCNTYEKDNVFDWLITSGGIFDQGECVSSAPVNQIVPAPHANNYFYTCTSAEELTDRQIKNFGSGFRYYSYPDNLPEVDCISENVDLSNCGLESAPTPPYNSLCPSVILPTIAQGLPSEFIISEGLMLDWLELKDLERQLAKNRTLSQIFAYDALNHAIAILHEDYNILDRNNLTLMQLGLGLNTFADSEIDSLLQHYPNDTLFANWAQAYSTSLDNGNFLSEYSNGELHSLFFQHMDSTQEALMDGFYAVARDSVFVYEIERIDRSRSNHNQGDHVIEENKLILYPNPANETLHVVLEGATGQIRILNLLGEEVYRNIDFSNYDRIPLGGFNNGVYIIQFMNNNNYMESLRFVVLK